MKTKTIEGYMPLDKILEAIQNMGNLIGGMTTFTDAEGFLHIADIRKRGMEDLLDKFDDYCEQIRDDMEEGKK